MATKAIIEERSLDMHHKRARMNQLHILSQQQQNGTWKAEDEALYQVARAEYYRAKCLLENAVNEFANKASGHE